MNTLTEVFLEGGSSFRRNSEPTSQRGYTVVDLNYQMRTDHDNPGLVIRYEKEIDGRDV